MSGSSLHEEQLVRSDEITTEERKKVMAEDLARIAAMSDDDIDLSDMPETDFSRGERGKFYRPIKDQVTLRIDRDVLAWFRQTEEKYQTAINAALREHMNRHRKMS